MLGKGFFGHVRVAKKVDDPNLNYAIKYMKVGQPHKKETLVKCLQQELILERLRHDNILRIHSVNSEGVYEKSGKDSKKIPVVYAVIQLARRGDLFDFVTSSGSLNEDVARFYFSKILNAMEYLHYSGIAHRDMKPENILLDQNYNPLLTDFGLSKYLSEIGFITIDPSNKVGTERSMAPELINGTLHSPMKDDLFALGYLLFMIVAGHPPFMSASLTNEHYKLLRENRILDYWKTIDSLHASRWCSDPFKHLITAMLAFDMTVRPSISELRAHPWMKGPIPNENEVKLEFERRQQCTLQHQIKEAKARKAKKQEAKTRDNKIGMKKLLAPHRLKASIKQSAGMGDESRLANDPNIMNFGKLSNHRPTIFISQETIKDIEHGLKLFFAAAKSIKTNHNKHKVIFYVK